MKEFLQIYFYYIQGINNNIQSFIFISEESGTVFLRTD